MLGESASIEGEKVDEMMYITIVVTGIVFFITQIFYSGFLTNTRKKKTGKFSSFHITIRWKLSGQLFLQLFFQYWW